MFYLHHTSSCSCATELKVLWRRAVGSAPFASMPLVTYIDGDDKLDIVAVPSTGDVYVLQGENGQNLLSGHWPYTAQQTSVHASPIQVLSVGFLAKACSWRHLNYNCLHSSISVKLICYLSNVEPIEVVVYRREQRLT